ncbi:sensor histidine kinase [Pseudoduganella violacea]|uniref:Sensor histidine kinase YesM n=1 Tax=Pseudoduganella violacea TaxID=1715466 RepID=A0A7W5B6Z3_9BURK|nr:histidine kinase [Pseudoduganella violacea]MBB3117310.1 sensor histidine kinase YesM [Pseudoduganella violacea]
MTPAPSTARSSRSALPTLRQAAIVTTATLLLSWLLHSLTSTPFATVFSRVGFVGGCLLMAYSAAGKWHPRWLAPGAARLLAIVLTAPLASLGTAVLSQGGNALAYLRKTETLVGHILMVILALAFGLLFSLLAMRNERRANERADRLQAELERNTLERELLDARMRLLQAQIEPHFLFNTLANVEALVAAGSNNAGPVLRHLIAYLRAAMPRLGDADATLDTELQLVRNYLELKRLRMPDRLQFAVAELPALAQFRFPAMALLTLVENAVRHGIDPSVDGGRIEVGGHRDPAGGKALVWVSDSGVGMSETAQPGTGLSNLRTRLQAFYGGDAHIELHEQAPHGLRVELHFYPEPKP